jgi:hypothetical protein
LRLALAAPEGAKKKAANKAALSTVIARKVSSDVYFIGIIGRVA